MTLARRTFVRGRIVASLALALAVPGLRAQNAADVQLRTNPLTALRDFEPPPNQDYQLGRGDAISIDFSGRAELNCKRIVGPDGRVTLPLAGSIELADKSRDEAAAAIVAALAPYYAHLSVTVGVDQYTSNRVLLLGAVERPGVLNFDRPPTLLEVITRGGGSPELVSASGVQAHSTLVLPERVAIYRGADKVLWVDLKGLLDSGSAMADLRLKRDDVVYVPSPRERYVSVLGEVQHPGALQLDSTTTLQKLIAEAGGLTPQAGASPEIRVIQPSTGKTRLIPFKALLLPSSMDLTLQSGDLVYIPESGFNKATYVLERLSPLVTMFTAAALFSH